LKKVEEWNKSVGGFVPAHLETGIDIMPGHGDGCGGTDDSFIEMRVPVSTIFDICNSSENACNFIEITGVLSNAGGSDNSNFCQSPSLKLNLPINLPPKADFIMPDTVCRTAPDQYPEITFDAASLSVDNDVLAGRDSLYYVWESEDVTAIFSNPMGWADDLSELNTLYTPGKAGAFQISLTLVDHYGCKSTTSGSGSAEYTLTVLSEETNYCKALPVSLVYFGAELVGPKTALLTWETASEINTKSFRIERKTSVSNGFRTIAEIEAKGDAETFVKYNHYDRTLPKKTDYVFYRLISRDYDGSEQHSEVISLYPNPELSTDIILYPNPVEGQLSVQFLDLNLNGQIEIISMTGSKVMAQDVGSVIDRGSMNIDLRNLPSGQYVFIFRDESGKIISKKFFKD
jgi:hypothetical protein